MIVSGGPRPAPGTLTQLFFDAADRFDKPDALRFRREGQWVPISHRALVDRVRHVGLGLQALGVRRGDRVAIMSENRPEWAIADWACLCVGMPDVSIYPNLPAEQAAYILRDSGAVAVFVSTAGQAAKLAAIRDQVPALRHVVLFDAGPATGADLTLAALEARGGSADGPERAAAHRREALAAAPGDLATLIYTSGTTGDPKGVMLTHDNFHSNVVASARCIPFGADEVGLSVLPLSHVFERMAGHFLMYAMGCTIAYAESMDTVAANMAEVRPTLMAAVPRLYEKMFARIVETANAGGRAKRRIFGWARAVAERWADVRLAGGTPRGLLALQYALARRLVFDKLRQRTGGRLRYFVSGGAPLSAEINKFFFAAGLTILEGYGLTETSPVIAVNSPERFRIGTVGPPIAGVEVTIAPDGEILTRGPHVMRGYFGRPDATAEAIDAEGFFHTGDIGELRDGFLSITDRKKDIIVTAGGKNIAPQPIENRVKDNRYVSQAVMIGDRRRYPVMLIVPEMDVLRQWATRQQLAWSSTRDLLALPSVRAKLEDEVQGTLEGLARFEVPKKLAFLENDFSIERGELTPSLKVKRRVIDRNYRDVIDALYAEEPAHAEA